MDSISVIISLAALAISFFTLLHSMIKGASITRLNNAQERSDLLTKIVQLRLEYDQEARHLTWLSNTAHARGMEGASDLLKIALEYKTYITKTDEHYENIVKNRAMSQASLVDMGHHIDALRAQVRSESKYIEKLRDNIEQLLMVDRKNA